MVKGLGPAVVLGAALVAWLPLDAQVIEQVLVNVNGDIVTLSEFEERQVAGLRERPELAKVPPNSPEFLKAVADMTPQLILTAVDDLLWIQRAHEHGWSLTAQRLDEIILNIRKANNLEDEAAFRRALQSEGLTVEKLRHDLEQRALIEEAQRTDVLEKIEVNDDEIRAYYDMNQPRFTKPAEITIREILIPAEEKAHAESVRARLLKGEPFPRLAEEVSASSTKSTGGLMGTVKIVDLDASLQAVFEPMQVGEITQVIQTTRGHQIFKLDARTDAATQPLDEVRGEISRRLQEQKRFAEMTKYVESLRARAKITWRHAELRKAYEYALTQRLQRAGMAPSAAPPKS